MLHRFRHSIASFSLPTRLNNPFHYTPHPLCELAARELRAYLCERKEWTEELSAGKMFGVLVVKDPAGTVGFLAAFSGNLAGSNSHEYFVPPIYDMLRPGDFFRTEEASISDLNRQIETLETAGRYRELLRTIEETETEVAREIAAAKARMRIAKTAREARRREHPDENTQTALVRESQYEKAELHRLKQSWKNRLASLHAQRTSIAERIESLRCERKARSAALQAKLFRKFRLLNALGEIRDLAEIFAPTPQGTPRPVQGSVRPPNCCNTLSNTGLHRWRSPNSGGEPRRRAKSAVTDTTIPPAEVNAARFSPTCFGDSTSSPNPIAPARSPPRSSCTKTAG